MTDAPIITACTTGRDVRGWQFVQPCYSANTWTWLMVGDQLPARPRRVVLDTCMSHTAQEPAALAVQIGRLSGEDSVKAGDPWNCPSWRVLREESRSVAKGGVCHVWAEFTAAQIDALMAPARYGITTVLRFASSLGAPVVHRAVVLVL